MNHMCLLFLGLYYVSEGIGRDGKELLHRKLARHEMRGGGIFAYFIGGHERL